MKTNFESTWVGIDVSKHHWDVAIAGKKSTYHFNADSTGGKKLLAFLDQTQPVLVCLEATGGMEALLAQLLHQQGWKVSVVNPRQVRDFARAQGQLAKTDRLDTQVIALFAAKMNPKPTEPPSENQAKLRSLRARRRQVSNALVQEKNRLGVTLDLDARRFIQEAIDFYQQQLLDLDQQIEELIQQDAQFQKQLSLLTSVPGVGKTTAAALMADCPELGKLNRRQAARLSGLAPINRDSGTLRGKRMIGGGRASIRQGLFMATLVATRHNPTIRAFYQQLLARGKAKMTALTACMRKLLLILNAILKENQPWKFKQNT